MYSNPKLYLDLPNVFPRSSLGGHILEGALVPGLCGPMGFPLPTALILFIPVRGSSSNSVFKHPATQTLIKMICVHVWWPQDPGLSHCHHANTQHGARTFRDSIGNSHSGSTNTLEVRCSVSVCAYLQRWVSYHQICRNTINYLGPPPK